MQYAFPFDVLRLNFAFSQASWTDMLPSPRELFCTTPIRQTTLMTTIQMKIWTFNFVRKR